MGQNSGLLSSLTDWNSTLAGYADSISTGVVMPVALTLLALFMILELYNATQRIAMNGSNNAFTIQQISLVMLIGLAAKNAILIVEFAVIEMERGKTLMEATLSAARIRLRPILMTSFAFILGCVPLALASGSGAYSRNIIGIVVIAGMTMATVVGIFLIPCSFYFIMKLFRVRVARKTVETEDPDEIIARKHLFHEAHESLKG